MNRILAFLLVAVMSLPPAAALAETVSEIAALVNDEPITTFDLEKERQALEKGLENKPPSGADAADQLRQAALDSLINKKLLEQKIRELDIKVTDDEVRQAIEDVKKSNNISQETLTQALEARGVSFDQYKAQIREQLERLRLISVEVRSKIQISEKEMREYFEANRESFQVDEAFHARQIFLPLSPGADEGERKRTEASAEKILSEARGGADFEKLARKHSQDRSSAGGGDLGFLKKGELLPEFEQALVRLKPGEISGLIRTSAGIHILKLDELREGKNRTFEEAKPAVEDMMYKQRSEERFSRWMDDLRKNAAVVIKGSH